MKRGPWALTLAVACSVGCKESAPSRAASPSKNPVRITQFYTTKPLIARDESTSLCYGVDNAATVRIDPPVESVWPALSRCVTVSPRETTSYTLTAEDGHGQKSSQSVTVTVTGPPPRFADLEISSKEVAPGQPVSFCFKAKNATAVRGGPGRFSHGGSSDGDCLIDNPRKTTSYRITIEGAGGRTDEANITVKVR
jgi:hypothetical protein